MRDVLRARIVEGRVTAGDIVAVRHLNRYSDPADLAPHVFEDRLPGFAETIGAGDMLVGTAPFGTGRSNENTVAALRACGVRMVVAPAFGRAFFRHCWDLGVPAVRTEWSTFEEGQFVGVDLTAGIFTGAPALPTFARPEQMLLQLAECGGRLGLPQRAPATYATITPIGSARRTGCRGAAGARAMGSFRAVPAPTRHS